MNRSRPNEPTCPVPLELLALLLRSEGKTFDATVDGLPDKQRASLALYCFERYHMRRLAFAVAQRCSRRSLDTLGGIAGRQLFEQATYAAAFDLEPEQHQKRRVTLARFVA